ncbi:MAG: molecular chaperone HtpG [Burkholderiales bacterium]|nr:MAG: molecular chaperone HtpG [Burkholderiales bacterium]
MGAMKETLGFQAEVRQLLDLMIHSLYSNREIFLRELISNASDACDKLRFEALDKPELLEDAPELGIRVSFDREARTITVSDNGIGMSRQDTIEHLGTIARAGTREFFAQLTGDRARDASLIGQFGVGFYSSFIVADRVTVLSRRAGLPVAEGVRWESDGSGEFTVEPIERPRRGTEVILHLRAPAEGESEGDDLLSGWRLQSIIRKFSDHISLPIRMRKEQWDPKADDGKGAHRLTDEEETVNQASALWARPKSEISDEQYREFFRTLSHDSDEPLAYTHNRVEGRTEYTQLLYLPSRAPYDIWDRNHRHGIKLYVRRVFIMDDAEQLMPAYLRFVRGVIDSNDLPLNVSREILQDSRDVRAIREGSTRRLLSMLDDLAGNEPEKYAQFWTEFGQVLKEGLGEDFGNQERIAGLLRFASTAGDGPKHEVSLKDYVGRMKEGQDRIFYVTGDSHAAALASPHLELFGRKGIEVLLLTDRIDEWMLNFLREFDGKPLVSVAKGEVDLGSLQDEAEKKEAEQLAETHKDLVERLKRTLGERVADVRTTTRLTDSASCLVSASSDMSGHLERLLRQAGQKAPERKPILEINPTHPLLARLEAEQARFDDWAALLFDQALLAEGGQLDDPAGYVKRVNAMLLAAGEPQGQDAR